MLAVSVAAQLSDVLLHVAHDCSTLALVTHVDHLLHHVVGIRVSDHGLQHAVSLGIDGVLQIEGDVDDGPDHLVAVLLVGVLQTLLHHIGGELVLGEVQQVGLHLADEDGSVCLPSVLHDELDDVVAVAVLHQVGAALSQLLQDHSLLGIGAVLQNALHHAAAVGVGGQFLHATLECHDNELDAAAQVLGHLGSAGLLGHFAHNFNALLDHVVTVGVVHTAQQQLRTEK